MFITIFILISLSVFIRCWLGFGFSMLFIPLASIFVDFHTAVSLSIIYEIILGLLLILSVDRFFIDKKFCLLLFFGALGAFISSIVIGVYGKSPYFIDIGMALIISLCLLSCRKKITIAHNNRNTFFAGFSSGFLNGLTGVSGPPVVVYYYGLARDDQWVRSQLTMYFLILYIMTFIARYSQTNYYVGIGYQEIFFGAGVLMLVYFIIPSKIKDAKLEKAKSVAYCFIILSCVVAIIKNNINI